jgi:hypothetical protein
MQGQLDILLDQSGEMDSDSIMREWDAIVRHEKVDAFRIDRNHMRSDETGDIVDNPRIRISTKDLMIRNPRTDRIMPLGRFDIHLNFGAGNVRFHNRTLILGGHDHPHIRDGQLCAGDFATTLTTLLRQRRLAGLVNMVFQVLGVITPTDDWGRLVLMWEEHDDDRRRQNGWAPWRQGEAEYPGPIAADAAIEPPPNPRDADDLIDQLEDEAEGEEF